MKIINNIFLIVLFTGLSVSPLIFWPWAVVPYEIPRVWFILRWIEILAVIGLVRFFLFPKRKILDSWLVLFVLGFISLAVVSSLLGVDLWKSIMGNYYRSDGLITLYHLAALFLLVTFFWEDRWAKFTSQAISFGTLLTGISIVLLKTSGGSFGNPNFLAGYLAITLPFPAYLIFLAKRNKHRLFWGLVLLVQMLTILAIRSWAGAFGLLLFITGLALLVKSRFKWRLAVVVLGLLSILSYLYIRENQSLGFVAEGRERIIKRILLGVGKRPIAGWGWANADYAFEAVPWPISLQHDVYVDKAHSMLLEVGATTGIIGLAIYIGIITRTIFLLIQKIKNNRKDYWPKILILTLFLYIFHSQTNVISINEEVIFWLIAGIAAS